MTHSASSKLILGGSGMVSTTVGVMENDFIIAEREDGIAFRTFDEPGLGVSRIARVVKIDSMGRK
jgi:hypothetical protein